MNARAALVYIRARFKREQEQEHRENYHSLMLFMLAQPTRKHPESLPRYTPLYETRLRGSKRQVSGEELLRELLGKRQNGVGC